MQSTQSSTDRCCQDFSSRSQVLSIYLPVCVSSVVGICQKLSLLRPTGEIDPLTAAALEAVFLPGLNIRLRLSGSQQSCSCPSDMAITNACILTLMYRHMVMQSICVASLSRHQHATHHVSTPNAPLTKDTRDMHDTQWSQAYVSMEDFSLALRCKRACGLEAISCPNVGASSSGGDSGLALGLPEGAGGISTCGRLLADPAFHHILAQ